LKFAPAGALCVALLQQGDFYFILFFSGQKLLHLHNIGIREAQQFFPFGVYELVPLGEL